MIRLGFFYHLLGLTFASESESGPDTDTSKDLENKPWEPRTIDGQFDCRIHVDGRINHTDRTRSYSHTVIQARSNLDNGQWVVAGWEPKKRRNCVQTECAECGIDFRFPHDLKKRRDVGGGAGYGGARKDLLLSLWKYFSVGNPHLSLNMKRCPDVGGE